MHVVDPETPQCRLRATQHQLDALQVLLEHDATASTTGVSLLSIDDWRACALTNHAWRRIVQALVFASSTALFTSATCAQHAVPRRSERPERLRTVLDRCLRRFPSIAVERTLPLATPAQLVRFHTEMHVDTLTQLGDKIERSMAALDALRVADPAILSPRSLAAGNNVSATTAAVLAKQQHYAQFEYIDIDADTVVMRHTLAAARTAAGGACLAVDRVLSSDITTAFCVVRPPGHHAEPHKALGFCFFNNVGVAALHAIDQWHLERVAIIDFDVHHGNGTQRFVESDPRLLYASLHQAPLFPNTGFAHECGQYNNIVNVPLKAKTTSAVYRRLFMDIVAPRVQQFDPQLILVSAGFDAHAQDPLADVRLSTRDYYWLTCAIGGIAWHSAARGRVVSVLEGGYHFRALGESAEQHLLGLVHRSVPPVGYTIRNKVKEEREKIEEEVEVESEPPPSERGDKITTPVVTSDYCRNATVACERVG